MSAAMCWSRRALQRRQRQILALLMLGLAACGGDTTSPAVAPTVSIAGTGAIALVSGAANTLTVRATDRQGKVVSNPTVAWSTADPIVASVTAAGSVVGIRVGTAAVTATYDGVSASVQVTVTAGAAARLEWRTVPGGATVGAPLSAQPVVELRDLAGNLATTSTNAVTASIVSGGGSLAGSVTESAVNGVATFTTLRLDGAVGSRMLRFASAGLQPVESTIALQAGAPAVLFVRVHPDGAFVGATFSAQPVIEIRDASGNLTVGATLVITA